MLCNLKENQLEEPGLLKKVFISNKNPQKLVSKTIIESRPRETLKEVLKGVQLDVQVKMTNGFYAHLNKNKGNKVDWKNVTFIDSEKLSKEER